MWKLFKYTCELVYNCEIRSSYIAHMLLCEKTITKMYKNAKIKVWVKPGGT